MIRLTGLASWEVEFPFPGSLTSTLLQVWRAGETGRRGISIPLFAFATANQAETYKAFRVSLGHLLVEEDGAWPNFAPSKALKSIAWR